jgi:hypothetical protein
MRSDEPSRGYPAWSTEIWGMPIAYIIAITVACVFATGPARVDAFSFDDINFLVGSGTNQAALVIDWVEGAAEPPALAWGYRWDGEARGRDMLLAIVAADPRLFAKLGGTHANPNAVYGLGYDADNDGQFGIDDGTTFNSSGIAFSGPADGAVATDSGDYYAEGWFMEFWHYGVASTNPYDGGSWSDVQFGMASRVLINGAWDSWAFEITTIPPFNAYAENPMAAPPPGGAPGDFNDDGHVDADDYDEWRSSFGSISQPAIDISGNGIVDAADYVGWRKHAQSSGSSIMAIVNAPEPSAICLVSFLFLNRIQLSRRKRKEFGSCSATWISS